MTGEYQEKDTNSIYKELVQPMNQESMGTKKIKENYLFFILISAVLGVFCTVCLYRNFSGITTPFFAIIWVGCCIAALKKIDIKITRINFVYIVVIMLFSLSTTLTTSSFVIFFNATCVFIIISIMLLGNFYDVSSWQFGRFIVGTISMIGQSIMHIFAPFTYSGDYRESKAKKDSKFIYIIIGLAISIPLVMVVLILLISADSVFSSMFLDIFKSINFIDIFGIAFLFCFASFGFFAVIASLASKKIKNEISDIKKGEPVIAITITSVLTVIYIVFCLIQIIYLFIGGANALPEGITYAEYARKGFFQLVFVSIINFGLVLFCIRVFRESKVLKVLLIILSACTYILIASSAYRMILYVGVYNLTFLRILVLWFLALLTVLMTGIIITIFNGKFNLFRFSLIAVISFYMVFSYAKPDQIIAEYNVSHIDVLTYSDVIYMVDELSYDAAPVISTIDLATVKIDDGVYYGEGEGLVTKVSNYFKEVENDYDNRGIRGFNFSSFAANKAVQKR